VKCACKPYYEFVMLDYWRVNVIILITQIFKKNYHLKVLKSAPGELVNISLIYMSCKGF